MRSLLPFSLSEALRLFGCAADPTTAGRFEAHINGALRAPDGRQMLLRGLNARGDGVFDVSYDDGRECVEIAPPLPHAVAGEIISVAWDSETSTVTVGMVGGGVPTVGAPKRV